MEFRINPIILAAGEGSRYHGPEDKSLMVVDQLPVLRGALDELSRMAFHSSDVYVVLNTNNRDLAAAEYEDSSINVVIQEDVNGPAIAVAEAYAAHPDLDEVLVIQADDAAWFDNSLLQHLTLFHERRRAVATIGLLARPDPAVHHNAYVTNSGFLESIRPGIGKAHSETRVGFNMGAYVLRRESFLESYTELTEMGISDIGVPRVINHMHEAHRFKYFDDQGELRIAAPIYDIPWKSANDIEGRDEARCLIRVERDLLLPSMPML